MGLAKLFERYVQNDSQFEILGKVTMGLVCFRLKVSALRCLLVSHTKHSRLIARGYIVTIVKGFTYSIITMVVSFTYSLCRK